jgi:hypothetical protein
MKAEELKEKFFNAAPRVEVIFMDAKSPKEKMSRFVERVLHPDEIKHPEKEIEIAELYEFPEGFDYWLVDRRREFIAECLNDKVSSYSGCHLQALISDKLESWLGLS